LIVEPVGLLEAAEFHLADLGDFGSSVFE